MNQQLVAIYTGAALNTPASNVIRIPTVGGTISAVYLDFPAVTDGDAEFELFEDGVSVTAITVADTTSNETVSISHAMTLGKVLSLSLLSPLPADLPAPPWSLVITYDDGVVVSSSSSSGGGGMGEDGPPGESWMIPGPPGPAGATGSTGAAGLQGFLRGEDGEPGESWMIPGARGADGTGSTADFDKIVTDGLGNVVVGPDGNVVYTA